MSYWSDAELGLNTFSGDERKRLAHWIEIVAKQKEAQYQSVKKSLLGSTDKQIENQLMHMAEQGGPNKKGKKGPIRRNNERNAIRNLDRFQTEMMPVAIEGKAKYDGAIRRAERNGKDATAIAELGRQAERSGGLLSTTQRSQARGLGVLPTSTVNIFNSGNQNGVAGNVKSEERASLRKRIRNGY